MATGKSSELDRMVSAAVQLHQRGQLGEAEALYRQVLARQPRHADAGHYLGLIAYQRGYAEAAADMIAAAIRLAPKNAAAHANLALPLQKLGRAAEALASCDRALALDAAQPDALMNRGIALQSLGRHAEAVDTYAMLLQRRPDHAGALTNRGNSLQQLGRYGEALESDERLLVLQPESGSSLNRAGISLLHLGRPAEALDRFDQALRLSPADADLLCNRALAEQELRRYDAALATCDQVLAADPAHPQALTIRGNVLQKLNRFEEAIAAYDRAIDPRPALRWTNRALALLALNRLAEAREDLDRALAAEPGFAEAHWNLAAVRLLTGDFTGGWPEYEWRWRLGRLRHTVREFVQPLWSGQDVAGRTVFVHAEQGFGDTLQFCRYVSLLAQRGARVLLEVQPPLKRLLQGLDGAAEVFGCGEPVPPFDLHVPLLSLPLAFGTTLDSIPSSPAYLSADAERVARWRDRLPASAGLRVGLAWAGRDTHNNDRNRSLPLGALLQLPVPGVTWVSLQKELRDGDQALLAARPDVLQAGAELADFADTAALLSCLDVVITVDTAVAHLAGALGRPVWLLLPFAPEWRWLMEREDSPWYPTARLYRQLRPGDWDDVLRRVADSLRQRLR